MDKSTLSQYGWVVICIIVLVLLIALATPFGSYVKDSVTATVESFSNKTNLMFEDTGIVDIPERTYTIEEINADDHLYAIGETSPEFVVAKFNSNYSRVTIFKNGEGSDGIMDAEACRIFLSIDKYVSGVKAVFEAEYGEEVNVTYDENTTDIFEAIQSIRIYSSKTGAALDYTENMRRNLNGSDLLEHSPKSIIIKEGIVNTSYESFTFCGDVKELVLPSTIECIESESFAFCTGLKTVVIPENAIIEDYAFTYCRNLTTVQFVDENGNVVRSLTPEEIQTLISNE